MMPSILSLTTDDKTSLFTSWLVSVEDTFSAFKKVAPRLDIRRPWQLAKAAFNAHLDASLAQQAASAVMPDDDRQALRALNAANFRLLAQAGRLIAERDDKIAQLEKQLMLARTTARSRHSRTPVAMTASGKPMDPSADYHQQSIPNNILAQTYCVSCKQAA